MIITGDFNLPRINWYNKYSETKMIPSAESANWDTEAANLLIDSFKLFNLYQLNFIPNASNNILDLVLTNRLYVEIAEESSPILKNDKFYSSLSFNIPIICNSPPDQLYTYRDFKAADYDALNAELKAVDWIAIFEFENIDLAVEKFTDVLDSLL